MIDTLFSLKQQHTNKSMGKKIQQEKITATGKINVEVRDRDISPKYQSVYDSPLLHQLMDPLHSQGQPKHQQHAHVKESQHPSKPYCLYKKRKTYLTRKRITKKNKKEDAVYTPIKLKYDVIQPKRIASRKPDSYAHDKCYKRIMNNN